MDVQGTPFRYGGQIESPLLMPEEDRLYLALRDGTDYTAPQLGNGHHAAASLRKIAERMECDTQYQRLHRHGVDCALGYGDRRSEEFHVVAVCVLVNHGDPKTFGGRPLTLNSAAACRLANRLDSGLPAAEAIRRTFEECESLPFTKHQVEELERNADAWGRRLDHLDAKYANELGGPEHRAAIKKADAELGRPLI